MKLLLCLLLNSSTILVYALKVVTADAMQQVKEIQAMLETNKHKRDRRSMTFLERKMPLSLCAKLMPYGDLGA